MQTVDAVIVGGGPGGSSCAAGLVASGLEVLVLDRAVFPRDKPCAGWITPPVVAALGLELDEYARGQVLQPITGFRIGLIGGQATELRYDRPVSYGILRREFDHYLLGRSGARVRAGRAVSRLRRAGGVWIVDDEIRTPLLVGAGGHFCPVARALGSRLRAAPVVAQEFELELDAAQQARCRVEPERPELYFSRDLKGYGWCFRKGRWLNVGLGRADARDLPRHVRELRAFLAGARRVPEDVKGRWRGHAYVLYPSPETRLVADGALLVGDAAGLAYSGSGEGIRPAVESGILAAELAASTGGDVGFERLEPYRGRIEARFGAARPPLAVPAAWVAAAGRALLSLRWFARAIVLERWFLHEGTPPLAYPSSTSTC